ncbi:MAG: TIGR02391 family protein [Acidimicrobiales bacterium]
MDLVGLDAMAVMGSLPQVGRKHGVYGLTYGLTWSRGSAGGVVYQPGDPVGLTLLGFHQVGASDVVETFLRVLAFACSKLTDFRPDPVNVATLEMTSEEVWAVQTAGGRPAPLEPLELYELLEHEPAMWTGSRGQSPDGSWRWEISRSIRSYLNVRTVEAYLAVVTAAAEESAEQYAQILPITQPIDGTAGIDHASISPLVPLLGSAIDPELWDCVRPLVEAGRWEQVARESAAFVETKAREWSGSKREALDLMSELLAPPKLAGPPDREASTLRNEQDGWHLLARGFFKAIRNHVMHNSVGTEEQLQYGLGALGTASLLVRRIRQATQPSSGAGNGDEQMT